MKTFVRVMAAFHLAGSVALNVVPPHNWMLDTMTAVVIIMSTALNIAVWSLDVRS